jgi:hypothetical protein
MIDEKFQGLLFPVDPYPREDQANLRNGTQASFMFTASLPDTSFYSDALCPGNDALPALNMNSQVPEHIPSKVAGLTHSLRVERCQCSIQIWTLLISDTYRPMVTTSNARIPY